MDELGEALSGISGLRVFPYTADRVVPPAAIVGWPDEIRFDGTMLRGMDSMTFPVWVVVGTADARSARDTLAAYLDGAGASSVKAAIDGGTYTACHSARVSSARIEPISIAGINYLAAVLDVEVTGRGGA
jgi:hypothetical protein